MQDSCCFFYHILNNSYLSLFFIFFPAACQQNQVTLFVSAYNHDLKKESVSLNYL